MVWSRLLEKEILNRRGVETDLALIKCQVGNQLILISKALQMMRLFQLASNRSKRLMMMMKKSRRKKQGHMTSCATRLQCCPTHLFPS